MPQLAPGAGTALAPMVRHCALPLPPAGWGVADALAAFEAARPSLRRFHDEFGGTPVPAWAPLSRLPAEVASLPADQAGVLLTARDDLVAALTGVRSELGCDTIHGDVSPSNVLRDGRAVTLIDL